MITNSISFEDSQGIEKVFPSDINSLGTLYGWVYWFQFGIDVRCILDSMCVVYKVV